jgi:serine/threonine protein phosphatase 1
MPSNPSAAIPVSADRIIMPKRQFAGLARASAPKDCRLFAIGDVHGRWDLLAALIRAIEDMVAELPPLHTKFVILGDFIDRGPDSAKIIELLMRAGQDNAGFVTLKGNHEATLVAAAHGDGGAQRLWLKHGGLATLKSYGIAPLQPDETRYQFAERICAGMGLETIEWLARLPAFLSEPPFYFCHAGVRPGRALHKQEEQDLLWIRSAFMESRRDHGAIVVHGHSVVEEAEVCSNRISLDTGAYYTGVLSAIMLDPEQSVLFRAGQSLSDKPILFSSVV